MPSKKSESTTIHVLKQRLDALESQFNKLVIQLNEIFGINSRGGVNTYELKIIEILNNIQDLDDRLIDLEKCTESD